MNVTQVAIRPTETSVAAGRPALTPELLAASGARYSRNNQGLKAILSKIDPDDLDKSVDSIFRMIDYGHQSIADMVPVAMFIDGVSILLAYLVWSWCPTAGGQESSTRYIRLDRGSLTDPELLGVAKRDSAEWYEFMDACFDAYARALSFWEEVGREFPALAQIPPALLQDSSEKVRRQVGRMRRNYAFDRARYFLPIGARTNLMLVMSARGWVQLCQHLFSHWLPEAVELGARIRDELGVSAPRMVKHAEPKPSYRSGHQQELAQLATLATSEPASTGEAVCVPSIELSVPDDVSERELVAALDWYDNRYAFLGSAARRTSVRFSWTAVAFAEVRDLNRHRTGEKYCPLIPKGFYHAADQVPSGASLDESLPRLGRHSTMMARRRLGEGCTDFVGYLLLGSQFRFEHATSLDKFIYEAALRTGPGAHFRYAAHLRDAVRCLGQKHATLADAIPLGLGEPE